MDTSLDPRPARRAERVDVRIMRATAPGFSVTTRSALRAVVSRGTIDRRIEDDRMWEIWRPVLIVGVRREDITPDEVAAAALLAAGPNATLDGASALERRGLWDRHDGTIHVTSDRGHAPLRFPVPGRWRTFDRWRRRRGVIGVTFVRSAAIARANVDVIGGLRTARPIDALIRASARLSEHQLAHVIQAGEYRRDLTLDELSDVIQQRRGFRGRARLVRAIDLRREGSAGTKSNSEDRLLPYVTHAFGEPSVNVRGIAGIANHEPDLCWVDRRWIVEVDGPHHEDDPAQRAVDLELDSQLRAAGWTIVRIRWSRAWKDVPGVVAELRATLRD